jgi:esterase/lipase superfamily enzyme
MIGQWLGRGLAVAIVAAGLSACGGRPPKGVMEPVATPLPAGATPVPLFVATTRARPKDPLLMFAGERSRSLDFARVVISVPPNHVAGEIEWPRSAVGDPAQHFVTTDRSFLKDETFIDGIRKAVAARPPGERTVLLFIHGYNTMFEEAVYRLAQIVNDSGFKGVPVLFTWPSRGQVLQYPYDRESAIFSRDELEEIMNQIARKSGATKFDVLAHSMGNMLFMETLRQAAIRGNGTFGGKLGEVMLAAPDIDIDVFRKQIRTVLPLRIPITIFVSADDKALGISKLVWGGEARAGATTISDPDVLARLEKNNITVVDLSDVKTDDRTNHGKFAASPQVVQLIGKRLAADGGVKTRGAGLGESLAIFGGAVGRTVGGAVALPATIVGGAVDTATQGHSGHHEEE